MATRRALVVGINEYEGAGNRLESCVNDAHAFAEMLATVYGFGEITMLLDRDATLAGFDAALSALLAGARPDDRLVLYYSGHGHQVQIGENREEVLVLQDGAFFQDDVLSERTQALPPGVLTVVLDSCFAGGMIYSLTGRKIEVMTRTKRWRPPPEAVALELEQVSRARRMVYEGFGRTPVVWRTAPPARLRATPPIAIGADKGLPPEEGAAGAPDEVGQLRLNALLLMASQEWQMSAADTPDTEGKSAFTYALLKTLGRGAWHLPPRYFLPEVTQLLHGMGFVQSPTLFEPPAPADLAERSFVLLQPLLPGAPDEALARWLLALLALARLRR